ncbi:alpha-glucan water dikinase 2 isoform X2 [Telopea speciosissima]|uniref:alpha-glucan water dikinase 2 isoform X2 n=1 Tax=Telopea speciosissima TaxID=54955 RepID=UPI001CC4A20C|nr:alpha-glucan water dikinase 2 isoform X2 [Telopea speciosissima]
MATPKSTNHPQVWHFNLEEGMQLQVYVFGSSNGCNSRVELQLKNCSRTWILHWGGLDRGQKNWVIPADHPCGTKTYKQIALQTPFMRSGDIYLIVIELRDPKIHAIEFVLKDGSRDRWLKLNQENFRIEIHENESVTSHLSIPKDLVDQKAYLLWESKGKPISSPQQQKQDSEDALRELHREFSRGISLDELRNGIQGTSTRRINDNRALSERLNSPISSICQKRRDVGQWLHKYSERQSKGTHLPVSVLLDLVEKYKGGDNVILRQSFRVGDFEIVVLLRTTMADHRMLVAVNMKGTTVLHWGMSKSSSGEWLTPPSDILPERSKLLNGACQTYFKDMPTGEGFFQFVDINLQQRDFLGVQFVIWSGGSWIKNNGSNFFVSLKPTDHKFGKGDMDGKGTVKWLLDEISEREKHAERSLMHRFDIATELTERCQSEGELGLIGVFVWLRFMACRQLTWNKNYNVKPREISAAQDKFTSFLGKIYLNQPNDREIVRLMLASIGRGGQGEVGQRIRDEILLLQRNNDCKSGMMEEWHQKLHNNSSPDDVIICQALLDYARCNFKIDVYWRTLNSNGLTRDILASYDHPIVSEPRFKADTKEGLILDLTSYLRTLKAVHSGVDLESAIESWLSYSSKRPGIQVNSVGGLSLKLQECLNFAKVHINDKSIHPVMEKLLESRIELHPILLKSHERFKDLLFLDISLASAVRTTMERGLKDLDDSHLTDIFFFVSLMLENLCLSTVNNEDVIYCTKDWYCVCESYKPNNVQWALQTKAVLDRIRLVLTDRAQHYQKMIQPSAQYLGHLLGVEKWAIEIFTEELIRAGSAPVLSMLINRLDPILRKIANLGCWQVISPVEVCGFVTSVNELITVQSKVYGKPTIIIANKVTGGEEIPDGVVGVLTPDMPDVLSHVSIRARNSKVCFATCFDQRILRDLRLKEGKAISVRLKFSNLEISSSDLSVGHTVMSSIPRGVTLKKKTLGGKYAASVEEFSSELVGAKSRNIQYLRGKVPSWIKVPTSVALPFGVFENILLTDLNKDLANKVSCFDRLVRAGDLSKLQAIQETILQISATPTLINELRSKMKSLRIPWPGDEGEQRWKQAWQAIKKVWASKWNERAYISCRKANVNHDHLCMAVLVQEVICADYAFVIHTRNPLTGDTSEIYTEIVKGLGETLVGAYPGRAMSFITKKSDVKSPIVVGYPSKHIGLFMKKQSLIFRSDSNGEDLEGYAGAGLYDSVIMDKEEEVVLDYSCDQLIVDKSFQRSLFSKIAEVGIIIENLYRSAQDIEGVVKHGEVYVVQTRPQI